jgi:hypothetical protein
MIEKVASKCVRVRFPTTLNQLSERFTFSVFSRFFAADGVVATRMFTCEIPVQRWASSSRSSVSVHVQLTVVRLILRSSASTCMHGVQNCYARLQMCNLQPLHNPVLLQGIGNVLAHVG